jgi:hypothetical protein
MPNRADKSLNQISHQCISLIGLERNPRDKYRAYEVLEPYLALLVFEEVNRLSPELR